jgi:hypothetical protein
MLRAIRHPFRAFWVEIPPRAIHLPELGAKFLAEEIAMSNERPVPIPSLDGLSDPDKAFDAAFGLLAFTMNRHLVDHWLRSARQLTGNDYDAMVVWGVLAHQNVAHLMPPGSMPSTHLDDHGMLPFGEQRMRPIRQSDLAQITGIPRETVRRKLEWLADQKFIKRTDRGWMVIRDRLEPDLREITRENLRRMLATADQLRQILQDSDQNLQRQKAAAATS